MSIFDQIRQKIMQIIAIIGGGGTGGSGGGGTPPAAYLYSITLTGPSSAVATYTTTAYTAVGYDQNGTVFSITPVFSSSSTGAATINSSTGVATGVAAGSTNITASAVNSLGQTITSNAVSLSVANRQTTTIVLTGDSTVTVGAATAAYVATAKDQLGNTLTGQSFTYQSSATNRATINSAGVATGVSAGTTSITAKQGAVTSNAITLTVGAQTVTSITITGPTSVIATHSTSAYSATAFDQNGTAMTGQSFTWQSSDGTKATIASTGVATGVAAGSTNITAKIGSVTSNTIALTVSAQVPTGTITLSPTSATIAAGNTQAFTATVKDQGTPANTIVAASVSWDTADHAKATVNGSGLVTGVAAGSTTLNATSGVASGSAALTIQSATGSINSTPTSLPLTVGTPSAVVIRDNNNNIVTDLCTFTSSDPSIVYADYQPAITSITPSTFTQGDTAIPVAIAGTNFTSSVLGQDFAIAPSTNLTLGTVTFTSSTRIDTTLTVGASAATGGRTATVTDTGHGDSNGSAIQINSSAGVPTVPVTSGRILHLMANAGTSTTTNGAALSSWTDQSATGAVFSGTGGARPTYVAVSQNGLPGILFDGIDDVLTAAGVIPALNVAPIVVFLVATRVSGTGTAIVFANNNTGGNGGFGLGVTSQLTLFYGNGSTTGILADPSTLGTACHQTTWIINPASGSARQQIYKDGVSVATGNDTYSTTNPNAPTIGGLNVPAGYYGNVLVHELIAYNATTNPLILTTDRTSVQSYTKTKWGTP